MSPIDLMVGYRRDNASPILRVFLHKLDELLARMKQETTGTRPRENFTGR